MLHVLDARAVDLHLCPLSLHRLAGSVSVSGILDPVFNVAMLHVVDARAVDDCRMSIHSVAPYNQRVLGDAHSRAPRHCRSWSGHAACCWCSGREQLVSTLVLRCDLRVLGDANSIAGSLFTFHVVVFDRTRSRHHPQSLSCPCTVHNNLSDAIAFSDDHADVHIYTQSWSWSILSGFVILVLGILLVSM